MKFRHPPPPRSEPVVGEGVGLSVLEVGEWKGWGGGSLKNGSGEVGGGSAVGIKYLLFTQTETHPPLHTPTQAGKVMINDQQYIWPFHLSQLIVYVL